MVTLNRDDCDISVLYGIFDHVGDQFTVVGDLLECIIPGVVGGVVAGPEYYIRLHLFNDVIHHALKRLRRDIAQSIVRSPFSSSDIHVTFSVTFSAAAQEAIAGCKCTDFVFEIKMHI